MKRPVILVLCGFAIGIVTYMRLHLLETWLIMPSIAYIVLRVQAESVRQKVCVLVSISFILGFFYTGFSYERFYDPDLDALNHQTVKIGATIVNVKDESDQVVLTIRTLFVNQEQTRVRMVMRVPFCHTLRPGDRILLQGTLRLPQMQRNPGAFDAFTFALSQRYTARLYAVEIVAHEQMPNKRPILNKSIDVRRHLIQTLSERYPMPHSALLAGMIIGYTDDFSRSQLEWFSLAGIRHIMAVSGANVAFLCLPILWLLKKVGVPHFSVHLFILPFLAAYAFITGFEASILRASMMASIVLLGIPLLRKSDGLNAIGFTCLMLLLIHPFYVFHAGFVLSFVATSSIVLLSKPNTQKTGNFFYKVFHTSFSAMLGIMPLSLRYFFIATPYALPANLFVIPITGLIVIMGTLSILMPHIIGQTIAYPVIALLDWVIRVTQFVAELPGSKMFFHIPSNLLTTIFYLVLGLFCLYRNTNQKPHGHLQSIACVIAVLLIADCFSFYHGLTKVTFIDVGQGDAIYIQTANRKQFLIDGGGQFSFDVGQHIMIPFLLTNRAGRLDGVFATHDHHDHMDGLLHVLETVQVKAALAPYYYKDIQTETVIRFKNQETPLIYLHANDIIHIDEHTRFKVFWPSQGHVLDYEDENHVSLTMMFKTKNFGVLLTGDIDAPAISQILKITDNLTCTILKVPHHGGINAGMQPLVDRCKPSVAVIQCGINNRFGHPHPSVTDVFEEYDIPVYRNDHHGSVSVFTNGYTLVVIPYVVLDANSYALKNIGNRIEHACTQIKIFLSLMSARLNNA